MIISIDGPAGSGKSTIAEKLSKKLGFIHFNSGSLYRGVACFCIDNDIKDVTYFDKHSFKLDTKIINNTQHVFVNNIDYTDRLRDNEVSILTPIISTHPKVRAIIDDCQKNFAKDYNVVIDGRDIGSFVFPNAEYKFYLDCSIDERAKRRFKEEKRKNPNIILDEIKKQIAERDDIDKHKKIAPLVIPKNAIIIDSTNLTINQVINNMLKNIK